MCFILGIKDYGIKRYPWLLWKSNHKHFWCICKMPCMYACKCFVPMWLHSSPDISFPKPLSSKLLPRHLNLPQQTTKKKKEKDKQKIAHS
uniref:Uncharacterized protein n=1 Tax=Anguilla anguilla TaxID=7936 RepID=A0A0E9WMX2_ANGAN